MAWDFLRKFLKLMAGKFVSKMAPRLLIFQYYDRLSMEVQEQRKKFRVLYQKSQAELVLFRMLTHKPQFKIEDSKEDHEEVSILEVHGNEDFWDDKTVSSHYESHDPHDFDFVQLQACRNAGIRVQYKMCDGRADPAMPSNNKIQLPYKYKLSKNQFICASMEHFEAI